MTREEFVESYLFQYGEEPDEVAINEYYDEVIKERNSFKFRSYDRHFNNYSPANDLLNEVRGIVTGIASSAKKSISARTGNLKTETYTKEFNLMMLIFLSKSVLYFLMKKSYEDGLDFSNI